MHSVGEQVVFSIAIQPKSRTKLKEGGTGWMKMNAHRHDYSQIFG